MFALYRLEVFSLQLVTLRLHQVISRSVAKKYHGWIHKYKTLVLTKIHPHFSLIYRPDWPWSVALWNITRCPSDNRESGWAIYTCSKLHFRLVYYPCIIIVWNALRKNSEVLGTNLLADQIRSSAHRCTEEGTRETDVNLNIYLK